MLLITFHFKPMHFQAIVISNKHLKLMVFCMQEIVILVQNNLKNIKSRTLPMRMLRSTVYRNYYILYVKVLYQDTENMRKILKTPFRSISIIMRNRSEERRVGKECRSQR